MDSKIKAIIPVLLFILACSGGSGGSGDNGGNGGEAAAVTELSLGVTQTATIETVGDVDTYYFRAAETNRFLNITCDEKASGSGVDLMVTVYEEDDSGERTRLFGKHKPLDATPPADIDMAIYIDTPKNLYITVRDVMDDDASAEIAYHLTCDFQSVSEENHDFANAEPLGINASNVFYDAIEEVGEVDCFTFSPDVTGVYSVTVASASNYASSDVQLAAALYDEGGNRIQSVRDPDGVILSYLDPADGPFYVAVHDSDDSDMDSAAVYGVSVAAMSVTEAMANDSQGAATLLADDGSGLFSADGRMEYASSSTTEENDADMDWYTFTLPDDPTATYQGVSIAISGDSAAGASLILRVVVYDEALDTIMSHDFNCSGDAYENRFRAESGTYYVSVVPLNPNKLTQGVDYRLQLQRGNLTDDDDNTENDAVSLTSGQQVTGGIGYRADVDWYALTVNTAAPGIVGVELISDACIVDYQLSIYRGTELVKKVSDLDGRDGGTHLKTAIYVPGDAEGSAVYHIKVCDAQNDEGSDVTYRLTATETAVPVAVADIAQMDAGDVLRYHSESDEQTETGGTFTGVELEIFSGYQPTYLANTDWLDFRCDILSDGVETTALPDGATTITFPWIAGYIDYQGDRDMFQIDFGKLSPEGEETEWYYDIEVRLVVPQPGSDVEYIWKLYRDRNQNNVIMDDPTSPDGYKACAGDDSPEVREELDITVPSGDQTFWIGSEWGEDAKFYFGVSDFNYEVLPDSGDPPAENTEPDDDWGYDAPYYFKLQLTYHPGEAWPD